MPKKSSPSPDIVARLALALVAQSQTPLLLLDGDLKVVAASASFCRVFHIEPSAVAGRKMFDLGEGEWNARQLRSLLTAAVSGHAPVDGYEMDLKGAEQTPRRLVINVQRLDYGHPERDRLAVTIADVTDVRSADRARDDLLREKGILLQETQHRVANSLQIIASVLMQSARKASSEETRAHLRDTHGRIMSIGALQQQLAASRLGDVALRPYFTQLCASLGASMIRDHGQLSIEVSSDDSRVDADTSVSLGLIVTELVINALKHAFPGERHGKIWVDYRGHGPNWTLAVRDDGVGMPKDGASAKPGLGTSIVEALARQHQAGVRISDGRPGTTVSIVHAQVAAVAAQQPRKAV